MSSEYRICLVIPSLESGGSERVMAVLANYFARQPNIEVHLVLYGIKREVFYFIDSNINIHRPDFVFNNKRRQWHAIKTLLFLRKKIRKLHPDTILSFGEVWNNFVLFACLGLPYPIFISDRCQPDKKWSRQQSILRKWLYPRSAGIIAQTQKAKDFFTQLLSHPNIQVIGNPIRTIENKANIEKENIVLTVGRLITTKHHDELIRIFARLNPPNWKLVIIGGDALKQQNSIRLKDLIKELGMTDKVRLLGERVDVEDFYLRSKIFAFASSSEGFPNVIGEAMSAGLPVVAYDCVAGPSDLIEHDRTGYLVPLHDTTIFEQYLRKLITDSILRAGMGEQGRERIKQFASEQIAQKVEYFIKGESTSN